MFFFSFLCLFAHSNRKHFQFTNSCRVSFKFSLVLEWKYGNYIFFGNFLFGTKSLRSGRMSIRLENMVFGLTEKTMRVISIIQRVNGERVNRRLFAKQVFLLYIFFLTVGTCMGFLMFYLMVVWGGNLSGIELHE